MSRIENLKSYTGNNLDTIFFRPMLTGPNAEELGIKVMYNVPVPTTFNFWRRDGDILNKYMIGGWTGTNKTLRYQKQIQMHRVKAELGYGADDYFSTVFELISARPDVNLDDLSGTELEEAETALFRSSVAESIRSTMWYGNTSRSGAYSTFDGFIKQICANVGLGSNECPGVGYFKGGNNGEWAEQLFKTMWDKATDELKSLRSEGNLVYFVSSDLYNAYEDSLDNVALEAAYMARQNGRDKLFYRGIPVVDLQLNKAHKVAADMPDSFAILTDRRNLALAVNTNDFPGTEVRMWYNPDVMENRQRAIFMAGCDYLLPELVVIAMSIPLEVVDCHHDGDNLNITIKFGDMSNVDEVGINIFDENNSLEYDGDVLTFENDTTKTYQFEISDVSHVSLYVSFKNNFNDTIDVEMSA